MVPDSQWLPPTAARSRWLTKSTGAPAAEGSEALAPAGVMARRSSPQFLEEELNRMRDDSDSELERMREADGDTHSGGV